MKLLFSVNKEILFFYLTWTLLLLVECTSSLAYCDKEITFNVIPGSSTITYTPISSDINNPSQTEYYDIESGKFTILIHQAACGDIFVNFKHSSFITNPNILPHGVFILPEGVAGKLINKNFIATSWGSCSEGRCDFYSESGTYLCVADNVFKKILGSFEHSQIHISGVTDMEPCYHFDIMAIEEKSKVPCFPWYMILPSFHKNIELNNRNKIH